MIHVQHDDQYINDLATIISSDHLSAVREKEEVKRSDNFMVLQNFEESVELFSLKFYNQELYTYPI